MAEQAPRMLLQSGEKTFNQQLEQGLQLNGAGDVDRLNLSQELKVTQDGKFEGPNGEVVDQDNARNVLTSISSLSDGEVRILEDTKKAVIPSQLPAEVRARASQEEWGTTWANRQKKLASERLELDKKVKEAARQQAEKAEAERAAHVMEDARTRNKEHIQSKKAEEQVHAEQVMAAAREVHDVYTQTRDEALANAKRCADSQVAQAIAPYSDDPRFDKRMAEKYRTNLEAKTNAAEEAKEKARMAAAQRKAEIADAGGYNAWLEAETRKKTGPRPASHRTIAVGAQFPDSGSLIVASTSRNPKNGSSSALVQATSDEREASTIQAGTPRTQQPPQIPGEADNAGESPAAISQEAGGSLTPAAPEFVTAGGTRRKMTRVASAHASSEPSAEDIALYQKLRSGNPEKVAEAEAELRPPESEAIPSGSPEEYDESESGETSPRGESSNGGSDSTARPEQSEDAVWERQGFYSDKKQASSETSSLDAEDADDEEDSFGSMLLLSLQDEDKASAEMASWDPADIERFNEYREGQLGDATTLASYIRSTKAYAQSHNKGAKWAEILLDAVKKRDTDFGLSGLDRKTNQRLLKKHLNGDIENDFEYLDYIEKYEYIKKFADSSKHGQESQRDKIKNPAGSSEATSSASEGDNDGGENDATILGFQASTKEQNVSIREAGRLRTAFGIGRLVTQDLYDGFREKEMREPRLLNNSGEVDESRAYRASRRTRRNIGRAMRSLGLIQDNRDRRNQQTPNSQPPRQNS